jgi:hypothetical protein
MRKFILVINILVLIASFSIAQSVTPNPYDETKVVIGFSGVYELLVYNHIWSSQNINAYLNNIAQNGGNIIRFFSNISWEDPAYCSSYTQDGLLMPWKKVGGKYKLDGNPEVDADWNQAYWDRLDLLMQRLEARGLTAWIDIWDHCSLKSSSWLIHPFYPGNNNNNTDYDFYALTSHQKDLRKRFEKRLVLKTLPYNPIYSTNEVPSFKLNFTKDLTSYLVNTLNVKADRVSHCVPKNGTSAVWTNFKNFNQQYSNQLVLSIHGCALKSDILSQNIAFPQLQNWQVWTNHGVKVVSSDGVCNGSGNHDINYKYGLSEAEAFASMEFLLGKGFQGMELVDRAEYRYGCPRLFRLDVSALHGLVDAYQAADPKICVYYPNGSEEFKIGQSYTIIWNSIKIPCGITIKLLTASGTGGKLFSNIANTGKVEWTIRNYTSGDVIEPLQDYKLQVRAAESINGVSVYDNSNDIFTISEQPTITVLTPGEGDDWPVGSSHTISWTVTGSMNDTVKIRLMQGDVKILGISDSTANDGQFSWTVPSTITPGNYYIRVKTIDNIVEGNGEIFNISELTEPYIRISSPNGGENWFLGSPYSVTWDSHLVEDIEIKVLMNDLPQGTIYCGANTGEFEWFIDQYLNGDPVIPGIYEIQVESLEDPSVLDQSDLKFSISERPQSSITVISPNGGESWLIGSTKNINWNSVGVSGNVVIQLVLNGVNKGNIYDGANTGSISWPVVTLANGNPVFPGSYKIQIKSLQDPIINDQSDSSFTIYSNSKVYYPINGSVLYKNESNPIMWNSAEFPGHIRIWLFQGNQQYKSGVIDGVIGNDGHYAWTIDTLYLYGDTIEPGTNYKLLVISTTDTTQWGFSGIFTIAER